MSDMLKANDKFYGELTQDYAVGDSIIYLTAVPDNVPTILVAGRDTVNETTFSVTNKTINSVTGVTRISGANVELLTQTPITCLNNAQFINQFNQKLVPDGGTAGQVLKKKSNSDGDYEFGDIVALPDGGTTGQLLAKKTNDDGDAEWIDPPSTDSIILTPAPANHVASGMKIALTAHDTQAFGDVGFINSDGEVALADADAIASASAIVMCADASIAANASGNYLMIGIACDETWNWTIGGFIYLTVTGTTGNTLSQTAPTGTDDVVQIMGVATHADRMYFNPQLVQVEHT